MSFDEQFAERIRELLAARSEVVEKRMFGGLCFMVRGHMCCGLTSTDFMVRVGPEQYAEALSQPHARPMDFTGKPLKGMLYVAPAGTKTRAELAKWVQRAIAFVEAIPAKKTTTTKPTAKKKAPSTTKRPPTKKRATATKRP